MLEYNVAKLLQGVRLSRLSYATSQPDVIVDLPTDLLPEWNGRLLVECKYSSSQPWFSFLNPKGLSVCDKFVFWPLHQTQDFFSKLQYFVLVLRKPFELSNLEGLSIFESSRKLPKYLLDYYAQALSYKEKPLDLSLVCIALKGKKHRFIYAKLEDLHEWINNQA